LRWNSSCFSAYAAQAGTISPQLRFGQRCATESVFLHRNACLLFRDTLNATEYLWKEMPAIDIDGRTYVMSVMTSMPWSDR
jgi:hypothetical protein